MIEKIFKKTRSSIFSVGLIFIFLSCAAIEKPEVTIKEEAPTVKVTNFEKALADLGRMTEIYDNGDVKILTQDINDNTGRADATKGEIPRDVTEILKTTLNSVGGNVKFIPYNPALMANMANYSNFEQKIMPDVIVTGGITEYDMGLESRETGRNLSIQSKDIAGPKDLDALGGKNIGMEYEDSKRSSLSSLTLDFNLVDFKTMAGLPRMLTTNNIKLQKAAAEKELSFSLLGPTFGLKGTVQKLQGRHAAVRLIVQLSMIQIIGKYLSLPYWRLLPNNAEQDPVVIEKVTEIFYSISELEQIRWIQSLLFISGFDSPLNGVLDEKTKVAMQKFLKTDDKTTSKKDVFLKLYSSLPLDTSALLKRKEANRLIALEQSKKQKSATNNADSIQNRIKQPTKSNKVTADDLLKQLEKKKKDEQW